MLQEMSAQRKVKLEAAISEMERISEDMATEETLVNDAQRQLEQVLEWAAIFDITSLETKRMILARIIERVTVSKGYKIHIEFKLTMA